jgi:4-amino-4-deoxy-L-arabinose transferase-like glycosyltransferase
VVMARTLLFDMLLTGLLTWALVAYFEAIVAAPAAPARAIGGGIARAADVRRGWLRLAYALVALAVLAKGLAGLVVFVAIVLVHSVVDARDGIATSLRALVDPLGIVLFAAIALPWHLLAMQDQPGFAWFYFVNEHVMRFLDARIPHDYHTGPWWYFLPRVAAYVFPWTLLLALPIDRRIGSSPNERRARRLLWIAFLVPLAIFSISKAKGDYYMLVGVPPLVLAIADRVARMDRRGWLVALAPAGWLLLLAFLAQSAAAQGLAPYRLPEHAGAYALASGLVATAAVIAALHMRPRTALALCAAAMVPGVVMFSAFLAVNETYRSARSLASAVRALGMDEVYVYRQYEDVSALAFYLDSPVGVVASRSTDLCYGMQLAPDHDRFPTVAAFTDKLFDESVVLVVLDTDMRSFRHTDLAYELKPRGTVGRYALYTSVPQLPSQLAYWSPR